MIVQPVNLAPPGEIVAALESAGEPYEIYRMEENDRFPNDFAHFNGLIILGGTMGANDDEDFPFLTEVKKAIQIFHKSNKPVLGVCLGAQLIANSFNKKVGKMAKSEFGMTELEKTAEGKADPLFNKLPDTFSFMEWHEDYFELPDEATLLASGNHCINQAFRIKDNIYGFQFHPEVNETILQSWVKEEKDWILREDPEFLEKVEPIVKPSLSHAMRHCREMVSEWVKLLRKNRADEEDKFEFIK
ncbi:type 1 glutamine amidotransferase [Siminovitchia fortis]|uniref:type 1 glutamine amidotransferase n=1 Tax=Siminovitchia fortis TaxID=254758 RepID=UPI001FD1D4F0|nr:type 1 glutamine amidotransferase [Siminovitchia fortis]